MATQAISGSSLYQEIQAFYQTRGSDLKQLGSALQSGDANSAQQIFNSLVNLGQSGPFSDAAPFAKSDRETAFQTIGTDLQAGDLAGAQSAFATLENEIKGNTAASGLTQAADTVDISGTSSASGNQATEATGSIYQQLQAFRQERKADISQLASDLQSCDVAGARSDYTALQQLGQTGPFKDGGPFGKANREQDFTAIGQALQSGDLAGAQQAFQTLEQTFGSQGHQPVPPVQEGGAITAPPVVVAHQPVPPVSDTSATVDVFS